MISKDNISILFLGFEKAYVQVQQPGRKTKKTAAQADCDSNNIEEVFDYDEIAATFKVRYMTAMEAYLRLHSYRIVQMSHQIYTLFIVQMSHQIYTSKYLKMYLHAF